MYCIDALLFRGHMPGIDQLKFDRCDQIKIDRRGRSQ